jgi:perosamine synthetase
VVFKGGVKMRIPVANIDVDEEEARAVYDVVKSGWLSMGRKVEEFEKDFKKYTNAKNAIAVNSGTSALHVALVALNVKEGDEVIIPSLTFISTANVVLYQKATPVLAECDPKTYNITPEEIEKRITKKTRAIIPVDMNGMSIDYDAILEVAEDYSLSLIADSAESLGATYKNKKIGGIAPIHCFSFFPNKNITTGEGGMITTSNNELAEKMRMIRHQGQDFRYHHVVLGYNYRMTEFQAAIGIVQLKKIDRILTEKEMIAKRYYEAFEGSDYIKPPYVPDYVTRHAWYMYAITVNKKYRDEIVKKLDEKGIETRLSFPPIHTQPLYRKMYGYTNESFPITYDAWRSLINIPIWGKMGRDNQEYVIDTLISICER